MAKNYVQDVSFYAPEQQEIARRRKMAELLMQQGQTPFGPTETVGGWAVPRSPMEGVGKMAQAGAGAYMQSKADERTKALVERMRTDRTQDYQALMGAQVGQPEIAAPSPEAGGGPGRPAMSPTGITPALIAQLRSPEVQQLAAQQMMKANEPFTLGPNARRFGPTGIIAENVRPEKLTAAGPTGAPETRFVVPQPGMQPIPQPVQQHIGPAGQAYNPYTIKPGAVLPDPNKPFQALPGGGAAPNLPYQKYEIGKALAGKPQVQTSVNMPPPSKVFENENKLRDDYTTASKPFVGIRDAYNTIQSALKGPITAVSTLAGATKFMKMIDPESVVRESELQMALKATGMFDRFMNLHNTVMKGQVLTPAQAGEIKIIAEQLYRTAESQQARLDSYFGGLAKEYGLSSNRVVRNQGAVTARPSHIPEDVWNAATPEEREALR